MTEENGIGHNSNRFEDVGAKRLRSIIERAERVIEEKKALGDDLNEIYSEAKGSGFDVKIIKKIIKIRSRDPKKQREEDALVETYKAALCID